MNRLKNYASSGFTGLDFPLMGDLACFFTWLHLKIYEPGAEKPV
jgi:hypothetical protein